MADNVITCDLPGTPSGGSVVVDEIGCARGRSGAGEKKKKKEKEM